MDAQELEARGRTMGGAGAAGSEAGGDVPPRASRIRFRRGWTIVREAARHDFRTKYLGSHLGIVWAFAQPAVGILVLWFVTGKVFRLAPVENFPFVLWLMAGLVPWYFVTDCLNNATHAVVGNGHLVKKVVFPVGILPVVKILSCLVIHLFFVAVLLMLFAGHGYYPTAHAVQMLYYLLASIALLVGVTWVTSSVIVFARDVGPLVGLLVQLLFWMTPIFWTPRDLPAGLRFLLNLNPVSYIVAGYREALIDRVWFWEHGALTIYYWSVTGAALLAGALIFRRLRPHFADVL